MILKDGFLHVSDMFLPPVKKGSKQDWSLNKNIPLIWSTHDQFSVARLSHQNAEKRLMRRKEMATRNPYAFLHCKFAKPINQNPRALAYVRYANQTSNCSLLVCVYMYT